MSVDQNEHLDPVPETEVEPNKPSTLNEKGVYIPPKIQKSQIRKLFDRLAKYTVFAGLGASSVAAPMGMEKILPHEEPPSSLTSEPITSQTFDAYSAQNGSVGGGHIRGFEKTSSKKPPIDVMVPEKVSENLHFTPSERIDGPPSSVIETTTTETPKKSAI